MPRGNWANNRGIIGHHRIQLQGEKIFQQIPLYMEHTIRDATVTIPQKYEQG